MIKIRRIENKPHVYGQLPLVKALLYGQVTRNQKLIFQRADQNQLIILANTAPITNQQGNITGALVIFEDITERKQVEQVLKQAQAKLQEHAQNLEKLVEERTNQLQEKERLVAIG